MATASSPSPNPDYFSSRPAISRSRPSNAATAAALSPRSPRTPRTPLLGRSISGQFGSPGALNREQDEVVVYELHPRYLSAGFAGESRPRCVLRFGYAVGDGRRVGDWRSLDIAASKQREGPLDGQTWAAEYELFRADVRGLDLGLVEDRLERAVRAAHLDFLQLDVKPRRAVLAVPSLLPTPVLEVALRVLFNHYTQPPVVSLLTTPVLSCVAAGLRNALIVDVGWEESTVTAVGEYRGVVERRSVRGGKMLVREMASLLQQALARQHPTHSRGAISFSFAEDVVQRLAWCNPSLQPSPTSTPSSPTSIPLPSSPYTLQIPFPALATPADKAFFSPTPAAPDDDDHSHSLPTLVHQTLLGLPLDLRALCMSRIILTGSHSSLPGLKTRLLRHLSRTLETRAWDPVHSYGSAKQPPRSHLRSPLASLPPPLPPQSSQPTQPPLAQTSSLPANARPHDHLSDPLSIKLERESAKRDSEVAKGFLRGVETLGAWSGASLLAARGVKGVVEVEREGFLRAGLKDGLLI